MGTLRVAFSLILAPSALVAAALCLLAAALAQFGRVSPRADLLTHFTPIWLTGGLLAILAGFLALGALRLPLILIGLATAVLAASLIVPEYLRDAGPEAPGDAPRQLKIIQINTWGEMNQDVAQTAAWIAAQDADIVTVQEPSRPFHDALIARTRLIPACQDCDVAIYSRDRAVRTEIPPSPVRGRPGPIVAASFVDARGAYDILTTHYSWPTPGGGQHEEAAILATIAARYDRGSLIITGDFNSTPWSFARRRDDAAFGIPRRTKALFSWPARQPAGGDAPFPVLPIDHVYAGRDWGVVSIRRGPRLGSDHYPIVVTLARLSPP